MKNKKMLILLVSAIAIFIIIILSVVATVNFRYSSSSRKDVIRNFNTGEFKSINATLIVNELLYDSYIYRTEEVNIDMLKENSSFDEKIFKKEAYIKNVKEENKKAKNFTDLLSELDNMEKYPGSIKEKLENIKIQVDMQSNDELNYQLIIVANLEEKLIGIKDIRIKSNKEQKNAELYYKLNSKGEKLLRDMINLE